jgi:hypothetical protein
MKDKEAKILLEKTNKDILDKSLITNKRKIAETTVEVYIHTYIYIYMYIYTLLYTIE